MRTIVKSGFVYFVFNDDDASTKAYDALKSTGLFSYIRLACFNGFDNAVEIMLDEIRD